MFFMIEKKCHFLIILLWILQEILNVAVCPFVCLSACLSVCLVCRRSYRFRRHLCLPTAFPDPSFRCFICSVTHLGYFPFISFSILFFLIKQVLPFIFVSGLSPPEVSASLISRIFIYSLTFVNCPISRYFASNGF